jgi:hypothetical protein
MSREKHKHTHIIHMHTCVQCVCVCITYIHTSSEIWRVFLFYLLRKHCITKKNQKKFQSPSPS